jgi:hypothetical protein
VTSDRRRTFCIVDAPSPEAIRVAAQATALPVDRITEVRVLDPHAISMPSRQFGFHGRLNGRESLIKRHSSTEAV